MNTVFTSLHNIISLWLINRSDNLHVVKLDNLYLSLLWEPFQLPDFYTWQKVYANSEVKSIAKFCQANFIIHIHKIYKTEPSFLYNSK